MNPVEASIVCMIKAILFIVDKLNPTQLPLKKTINFNAATHLTIGAVFMLSSIITISSLSFLSYIGYNYYTTHIQPTQLTIAIPLIAAAIGIYTMGRAASATRVAIEGMWLNASKIRISSSSPVFSSAIGIATLPNKAKTKDAKFLSTKFKDSDGVEVEIIFDTLAAESIGINILDTLYSHKQEIHTFNSRNTKREIVKGTELKSLKDLYDKHGAPERKVVNFTPKKKD